MSRVLNFISEFLFKKISAKGMAIFRIAYCFNFLLEIFNIYKYRHLYFDQLPYIYGHFKGIDLLLVLWMLIIGMLILGWKTRMNTIINYVFTVVFISSMTNYEYHMIHVYKGINLLFILLPIHKAFSIDAFIKKMTFLDKGYILKAEKISKINYLLAVFVGIGLVYFDAVIVHKINSVMWLKGLGIWLPSSLPQLVTRNMQFVLNNKFIILFLSYLTMAFEFMFVFLFWNRKYRVIILIIGIGLHLGIFLLYPIPYFAMGYIALYLLLIPVSWWDFNFLRDKKESLTLYFSASKMNHNRLTLIIKTLDIFKKVKFIPQDSKELKLIDSEGGKYYNEDIYIKLSETFTLFQILRISLIQKYIFKKPYRNLNFKIISTEEYENIQLTKVFNYTLLTIAILFSTIQLNIYYKFLDFNPTFAAAIKSIRYRYLGLVTHGVFVDSHFKGYTNVYALKYKGEFLPIIKENGLLDEYLSGGSFSYWIFRVNGPYTKPNKYNLRKGLVEYSSFWSHENGLNLLKNHNFEIVKKTSKVVFEWKKDLLKNNMDTKWESVGILNWNNKTPKIKWKSN